VPTWAVCGKSAGTLHCPSTSPAKTPSIQQALGTKLARSTQQTRGPTMPKGEQKTDKNNKPKLTTAEKQKKKKEKAAAKDR
jgi:hypothetical protein